jgi:hypothetical protein
MMPFTNIIGLFSISTQGNVGEHGLSTGEKRARPLAFVTGKTAAARCGGIGEAPEIDRHNWPRRHDQTLFKVYYSRSGYAAGEGNDAGEIAGRTIEAGHEAKRDGVAAHGKNNGDGLGRGVWRLAPMTQSTRQLQPRVGAASADSRSLSFSAQRYSTTTSRPST